MIDKTQVLDAIQFSAQSCTAALTSLDTRDAPSVNPPALHVLHKDLISLLNLVYAHTTKLAICLKPASPTHSAAISPLQEMSKHVIAIATCAALFDQDVHGATLAKEVRSTAREVLESVEAFLKTLRTMLNSTAAPEENHEYLVRTGAVHELIEHVRGPNGLSKNNLDAVRRKWDADQGVLKDAFKEFEEMLEESAGEADEEEDEFGDGWDELGLEKQKMTEKEFTRAKSIHPILRLVTLLHKRIQLDILVSSPNHPPKEYDSFVAHSSSLLSDFDEVVATLYPIQQPEAVSKALQTLVERVGTLRATVQPFFPAPIEDLTGKMAGLSVDSSKKPPRDVSKWFTTCFIQIESLFKAADTSIQSGD